MPEGSENRSRAHVSSVTKIALVHLERWVEVEWNSRLRSFAMPQADLSFRDLICRSRDFDAVRNRIGASLEELDSADALVASAKKNFIEYVLDKDLQQWREELGMVLQRRSHHNQDAVMALAGFPLFYFWFCEARVVISGRPLLPIELGTVFGHGPERVKDFLQEAHRRLRETAALP